MIGRRPALILATALISSVATQPARGIMRQSPPRDHAVPARIVSLVPSATELIIALGAARRLVARTDFDVDAVLAGLPSVGGTVDANLEAILSLRPDLVLTWDEKSAPRQLAALQRARLRVDVVNTASLADLRQTIPRLGHLLGIERRADSLSRRIEAGLDSVRWATRGRARVRAFYVAWPRPLMTTGGGTFVDSLIAIAGGANVFGELAAEWPAVSMESVVARQPEVIVWPRKNGDAPGALDFDESLRVVQRRGFRIAIVNADLMARPGARIVEAARELARVLHGFDSTHGR